jgi:hypothetical protein
MYTVLGWEGSGVGTCLLQKILMVHRYSLVICKPIIVGGKCIEKPVWDFGHELAVRPTPSLSYVWYAL